MLSTRFTEYGLTGTFFIITQFVVFYNLQDTKLYDGLITYIGNIHNLIGLLSSENTASLLTALAFVSVFVIGLSVDLFGSLFGIREMKCLATEIKKNSDWLLPLTDENDEYMKNDYNEVLARFEDKPLLKRLVDFKGMLNTFHVMNESERIRSFYVSYVLVNAGVEKSKLLTEQIHLWRTGRGISLIIWLFSLEMLLLITPQEVNFSFWILLIFGVALFSSTLATSAYQRMLTTLFSLLYVTVKKETQAKKN